jgi:hypothetical protein
MAWNVNFDPRVAVTVPVSRTFEPSFDFIFFDWDMSPPPPPPPPPALTVWSFQVLLESHGSHRPSRHSELPGL